MALYASPARASSRARNPHNNRRRADFARGAVFAEFRARDAKAILDIDFIDRAPAAAPRLSPEARPR